jgi:hypothetical protein
MISQQEFEYRLDVVRKHLAQRQLEALVQFSGIGYGKRRRSSDQLPS